MCEYDWCDDTYNTVHWKRVHQSRHDHIQQKTTGDDEDDDDDGEDNEQQGT